MLVKVSVVRDVVVEGVVVVWLLPLLHPAASKVDTSTAVATVFTIFSGMPIFSGMNDANHESHRRRPVPTWETFTRLVPAAAETRQLSCQS